MRAKCGICLSTLDEARKNGGDVDAALAEIDNYETHIVPIIADIDAGFGNEEATYLLAKTND